MFKNICIFNDECFEKPPLNLAEKTVQIGSLWNGLEQRKIEKTKYKQALS
jgi:hypothetical protein